MAHEGDEKLGNVSFPITCKGEQAKFDRAVALMHNFFYPETSKVFREIIRDDPDCAIAYWGLATSLRPNPLVPPFPQNLLKEGWEAVQKGKSAKTQSAREAAFLGAIEQFYKDYDTIDQRVRAQAYSRAMGELHQRYPEESEAAIFYALSLLETIDFSDENYGNQLKAAQILKAQAENHPKHPGIAHYLIHSYDFAPLASMCVDTARLYDKIAANSPHALHMPSHIYSMLGMWDDSIRSNLASEALANGYAATAYPGATDAQIPHDLDFLMYAYLQQGRDNEALGVISRAAGIKKMAVIRLTVDTALAGVPARYVIERRAWNEAAALSVRETQYPAARSVTYFTRGLVERSELDVIVRPRSGAAIFLKSERELRVVPFRSCAFDCLRCAGGRVFRRTIGGNIADLGRVGKGGSGLSLPISTILLAFLRSSAIACAEW
jgi:hypothetical protein